MQAQWYTQRMGRLSVGFRVIHWGGVAAAAIPAAVLLCPRGWAVEVLAPGGALQASCSKVAPSGVVDEAATLPLLWHWLREGRPDEAFRGCAAPIVCAAAFEGLVAHASFELLLAFGLSLPLMGKGLCRCCRCRWCRRGEGVQSCLQRRILIAWALYGTSTAIVKFRSVVGDTAWLDSAWPALHGLWSLALAGLGVSSGSMFYFMPEADDMLDAAQPQAASAPGGYLRVGEQVPSAAAEHMEERSRKQAKKSRSRHGPSSAGASSAALHDIGAGVGPLLQDEPFQARGGRRGKR